MNRYYLLANWRFYWQKPTQPLLALLGIIIGLAVIVAIDIVNVSAKLSLSRSIEVISGTASHHIRGAHFVSDQIYQKLRLTLPELIMTPLIHGYATATSVHNEPIELQVLGLDLVDAHHFRSFTRSTEHTEVIGDNVGRLMAIPDTVLIPEKLAKSLNLQIDAKIMVKVADLKKQLTIIGLIKDRRNGSVPENMLVTDIATAQQLFTMPKQLSQIDLLITPEPKARKRILTKLNQVLPDSLAILDAKHENQQTRNLTAAFHENLTALSLLALFVGTFLVYNAASFMFVQRIKFYAIVRSLGISPQQLLHYFIMESLLFALLGYVLGVLAGVWLAEQLLSLVLQTIDTLYYDLHEKGFTWGSFTLIKAALAMVLALLIALLQPWYLIQKLPPVTLMQKNQFCLPSRGLLGATITIGLLGLLACYGLLQLPLTHTWPIFAAQFMLVVGSSALIIPLFWLLYHLFTPWSRRLFGTLGVILISNTWGDTRRSATAVMALTIALATSVAMGINVQSFRDTVESWLGYFVSADLYIRVLATGNVVQHELLPNQVVESLFSHEQVAEVSRLRYTRVRYEGNSEEELIGLQAGVKLRASYHFLHGQPELIWRQFDRDDAVMVSESFAHRHHLQQGDKISLLTTTGDKVFTVAGVYTDYSSDRGSIRVRQDLLRQYWQLSGSNTVAVYLIPGTNVDSFVKQLKKQSVYADLKISTSTQLQKWSMQVFDETFAITRVMTFLALLVAWIGLLSALLARQMEKRYEQGLLRVLGITPIKLASLVFAQTLLLALTAALLALPLGCAMASLLIDVMNPLLFGWTVSWQLQQKLVVKTLLVALASGLLAGLYPAKRAYQIASVHELKHE